jgi:hypothetical protein
VNCTGDQLFAEHRVQEGLPHLTTSNRTMPVTEMDSRAGNRSGLIAEHDGPVPRQNVEELSAAPRVPFRSLGKARQDLIDEQLSGGLVRAALVNQAEDMLVCPTLRSWERRQRAGHRWRL